MLTPDRSSRRTPERERRRWAVAPVVLVLLSSILVGSLVTTAAAAYPSKLLPSSGVYFGERVEPRGSETSQDAIKREESKVGRKLTIDHQYYNWDAKLPTAQQKWDVDNGRIPFVNWNAGKGNGSMSDGARSRTARRMRGSGSVPMRSRRSVLRSISRSITNQRTTSPVSERLPTTPRRSDTS